MASQHTVQQIIKWKDQDSIAVIGLGYTGLPLLLELAQHYSVIGYDKDANRVTDLQNGIDVNREADLSVITKKRILFTSTPDDIATARLFIITVPTPVDSFKKPDLRPLEDALHNVGQCLKKGDCVVIESTVYPGCTEEFCAPLLEKNAGLKWGVDFAMGYSPERINPGDRQHQLRNVVKLVAASDEATCKWLSSIYASITVAGVYSCSSIKVAEAAKLTENIQRDVNIALLNELSHVYQQLGIAPAEIWDAASTKWNFLPFRPGLAGGHCISVDPYYLLNKAAVHGISSPLVSLSREINEQMVERVFNQIKDHLLACNKSMATSSILIMGISFKPNVVDTRNAKAIELAMRCSEQGLNVEVYDPVVAPKRSTAVAQLSLIDTPVKKYDIILMAVGHQVFKELEEDYFCNHLTPDGLMIDLSGYFRTIIKRINYLSI